jgi:DNA-binding NtrC family response regulator
MKKATILIADNDGSANRRVKTFLLEQGYDLIESRGKTGVLRLIQNRKPDLVIVGFNDGMGNGFELADQIRKLDRRLPMIWTMPNSTEELILSAFRAGVRDYLKQPFSIDELTASIQRCLHDDPVRSTSPLEPAVPGFIEARRLVGESTAMRQIKDLIAKVARTDSNVLITGETGTGKELVADLIHLNSRRRHNVMVSINCAAIPDTLLESELFGYERGAFTGANTANEGKLKLAEGGTVFFDEVGDMSPYAQSKILRAIESREVRRLGGRTNISLDIRVIAATNQDLDQKLADGTMRKDLYYRLSVARIHLPPLRDRKEDVPALLEHYLRELSCLFGREIEGFTEEAFEHLIRYDWPGNVRELKNLLEAIVITASARQISLPEFPEQFRGKFKDTERSHSTELDQLISALFATNWNKSLAAQKLGWSRMTLYRKIAKYRLELNPAHPAESNRNNLDSGVTDR